MYETLRGDDRDQTEMTPVEHIGTFPIHRPDEVKANTSRNRHFRQLELQTGPNLEIFITS